MTPSLVGVRVGRYGPLRLCNSDDPTLAPGDRVIIDGPPSERLGTVVVAPHQYLGSEVPLRPQGWARLATAEDLQRLETPLESAGARLLRSLTPPPVL